MEITTSQKQGRVPVTVLAIRGQVDSSNYQQFTEAAFKAVEGGAQYLLLDLAEVPYMSSAGIRSVNEIYMLLRKKFPDDTKPSKRMKLCRPMEKVYSVLEFAGVASYLEIGTNLDSTVTSF